MTAETPALGVDWTDEPGVDPRLPGPLTTDGERVFAELELAAVSGRGPFEAEDLRILACAVQSIADIGQQIAIAAGGEVRSLREIERRLRDLSGSQLWFALKSFTGRRPIGPVYDGPCGVSPIDLGGLLAVGMHLGDGIRDPGWTQRGFAEYRAFAGPVERVLTAGREWMGGAGPEGLRAAFGALREIGRPGGHDFSIPCLDEQQVCLGEMLNFSWESLGRPPAWPSMASLTPADVCQGYTGVIAVYPKGVFPPSQAEARGVFPTIDRDVAEVVSWSSSMIVLRPPATLKPGCHTVGWGFLFDPTAVLQLRGISGQCLPWFPTNGFLTFPMGLWTDLLSFSVIGAPDISFTANGAAGASVEACTRVELAWDVRLDACPQTQAARRVSMLRDDQPFRPSLPTSGRLPVTDADSATYLVRAVARIGAQSCGSADRSVTVTRTKRLTVAGLLERCLDTHATFSLDVTASCPAPAGGLPVTVTSSHPTRVPGATVTMDEGSSTVAIEAVAGAECGPVALTIGAPGHTNVQFPVVVVAAPQIATLSPTAAPTCSPVSLTLTGTCLGDPTQPPQAWLIGPQGTLVARVTVQTPQTRVELSHQPLEPGVYTVALANCGRIAYAPTPLSVAHPPPLISKPLQANATLVLLCDTPTITLSWEVRFAAVVRLMRGATMVAERTYDPCQTTADSVNDTLPTVNGPASYLLTATNPDGVVATSPVLTIPLGTAVPVANSFAIQNQFNETVNAFMLNAENTGGTFLGSFAPGQGAVVSIPACRVRGISSLNPKLVAEHNSTYPNNKFNPTAVSTARTLGGLWQRTFSGYRLGHPTGGVQGVFL